MSRRFPGRPYTPPAAPLTGIAAVARTLRAALSAGRAFLVRPATLLIPAALLAGLVIGSVGTANERAAYGKIEPLLPNESPLLATAATAFEAQLAAGGVDYRALYRPFVQGVPTDDAGLGVYSRGFLDATRGYLQTEVVSRSTLATLEAPGVTSLFRRQVVRIVAGSPVYRWSRTAEVGTPGRTDDGMTPFTAIDAPLGHGADLRSVRLIPTLLRAMEITAEEASSDGGRDLLGRAPIYTYPGAVVATVAAMSDAVIVVALHLDADGQLRSLAVRAVNLNMVGVEYVTELQFATPATMPSWARAELR